MIMYFNKEELISFGEYMVSDERTQKIINHPSASKMAPVEERLKQVHPLDFDNWLDWAKGKGKDLL